MGFDQGKIGHLIREDRKRLGETQPEYARRLGLSTTQVARLEQEKFVRPSGDVVERLRLRFPDLLLARSSTTGPPPSAPAMHSLLDCAILTAPERAMKDATFRWAWKVVGQVWRSANRPHRKASARERAEWEDLVRLLKRFEPVGETPEPATEKPWPESSHPLHR